jgi:uncharacterized 2Fe-2S/4Fe-4S cluster protein (DUF4445 family)
LTLYVSIGLQFGVVCCAMNSISTATASQAAEIIQSKISVRTDEQILQLSISPETSVRDALDATELRVRAACCGHGGCGACQIRTVSGEFNQPTLVERQKLLPEDLADGIRLACQLRILGDSILFLERPAAHSQWKSLDASSLYHPAANPLIRQNIYAVAVDLGTTHIRLSLWNRQSGRRIGTRYSINPQIAYGADVLTRLDAEHLSAASHQRLCQQARKAIIDGIHDILRRDMGEITPILKQVGKVLIVGNTAMLTLVCGNSGDSLYQPENWQRPIACLANDTEDWLSNWSTPNAQISIVQPLAGFIGSDLLADLLATAITQHSRPALLVDFGTNIEIALWDGTHLLVTSVPGGPAFEGVGLRNGMTAETGAIFQVGQIGDGLQLATLGDTAPRGYCASGFIDAIALLLDEKQLKASGRFADPAQSHSIRLDPAIPQTAIFASDIDMFQRAKASTAAAIAQLLTHADLTSKDLDSLWICGSFGQHLQLRSAFQVGLLPTLPSDKVNLLSNASLAGCEQLLLDPAGELKLADILTRASAVNLGGLLEYENRFIDHLRLQPC